MVLYAEDALQTLERQQRKAEGAIRQEARLDLNRRGIVPTETAIAQWRAERMRQIAEQESAGTAAR
jgi:hypothetical protein